MGANHPEAELPIANSPDIAQAALVALVLLVVLWMSPIIYRYWTHRKYLVSRARPVRSRLDGVGYRVHHSHVDRQKASDKLAFLHSMIVQLIEHLDQKYQITGTSRSANYDPEIEQMYPERCEIVRNIVDRYNPDRFVESSPKNPEGDTSYTLFKGSLVAICLREKNPAGIGNPNTYDIHTATILWFVTVHELAHLGIDETGHPPEFWSCFKFLLQECEEASLVPPGDAVIRALQDGDLSYKDRRWPGHEWPNYEARPVPYCGLLVDYNPVFDPYVITPV